MKHHHHTRHTIYASQTEIDGKSAHIAHSHIPPAHTTYRRFSEKFSSAVNKWAIVEKEKKQQNCMNTLLLKTQYGIDIHCFAARF